MKNELECFINSIHEIPTIENRLKGKKIVVYGAGVVGSRILPRFIKEFAKVDYFIDINADDIVSINGIDVHSLNQNSLKHFDKTNTLLIIAVASLKKDEFDDICTSLNKSGYTIIISFAALWYYYTSNAYRTNGDYFQYYKGIKNKIISVLDLFEDDQSKQTYINFIKGSLGNYSDFSLPTGEMEYFSDDINFSKSFSRYVECGALDGGTINDLNKKIGKIDKLAVFEPEPRNFKKTLQFLKDNKDKLANEVYVFPCAIWNKQELLKFDLANSGASAINEYGDGFVQGVAMDDVLLGFNPTFIKMDIEGAEYNALLGASNIIKQSKPDMAICVYHSIDDLWNIPLLINSWRLGYKFFLRAHWINGFGTVLYAISD